MNRTALRGGTMVIISAAGFGLMPIFARYAYAAHMNVPTLLLLRFALAAVALLGFVALRRQLRRLTRRELGALLLLGAVLYAAQSMLYFSAVRFISPALAVLLLYLYPAFVLLLSAAVERRRPSVSAVCAIALSLAGMVLVVGRPSAGVSLVGVACATGAAMVYAVYIIIGNRVSTSVPPLTATAFVALFAAASFSLTGAVSGSLTFDFPARAWPPILGVALFSTVIAISTFFAGMSAIGPTRASIMSMVEPAVSIVAAWLLLNDRMTVPQMVGGVVVLTGAVWGVVAPASAPAKAPARRPGPNPAAGIPTPAAGSGDAIGLAADSAVSAGYDAEQLIESGAVLPPVPTKPNVV